MPTNAELIRRWFEEVWNQEREATIDELCAEHVVGYGQTLDGSSINGAENFKIFWKAIRSAFNPIHVDLHRIIEQGDLVMAQWTITMTHTGNFMGIQSTGKKITTTGMSLQRYENGKIVEGWDNWDQLGALVQMGAVSLDAITESDAPQRKSA